MHAFDATYTCDCVLDCNSYHCKNAVKQSMAKEWKRFSLKKMIHFLFLLLLCKLSTIIVKNNIYYMCALTYGLLLCRYLLNPYTILTCGGLSTILLVNLAIVWSLWMRLRGNPMMQMVVVVISNYEA